MNDTAASDHDRDRAQPERTDLDTVLITSQLATRPYREPDYKGEAQILFAIARMQHAGPEAVLDELLFGAMALCGAGTVGISLLETDHGAEVFRWTNLVGVYAEHVGGSTPRDFSPCGVTVDRGCPQLFAQPGRHFSYFQGVSPAIEEGLVVPFSVRGQMLGTMWIVSHHPGPAFDGEHARVLMRLATFAGSAIDGIRALARAQQQAHTWRTRAQVALDRVAVAASSVGADADHRTSQQLNAADADIRALASSGAVLAGAWEGAEAARHAATIARRQAEDAHQQAESLVELVQALAGELDPAQLALLIARLSAQAVGARFGAFLALTDETLDGLPIMQVVVSDRDADAAHAADPRRDLQLAGLPVTGTVVIADLCAEAAADPLVRLLRLLPHGELLRACMVVPIHARSGALLGNVLVADPAVLIFAPRHERSLHGLVAIAAQSLDNARRFRDERAIRRQIEERERLARLYGDIGRALIAPLTFEQRLARCCTAILTSLDAAFVRIWILDETRQTLVLRTSVGMYTHLDGQHARIPMGAFKIGRIAQKRAPHVTNQVQIDPEVSDQAWAKREGMVAFAGYPLEINDEILGVIGLFARHELSAATIELLAAASVGLAASVDRHRKDLQLGEAVEQLRQSNQDLERFAAIASHDLLEPTRTVTSFMDLLQRRAGAQLDDRAKGYVQHATHAAERMGALIRSLLAYAQLSGTAFTIEAVPLDAALDDAVANLAARISEVEARIERAPLPTILGNRALLGQLFQNLLANALKFRQPGRAPRIAISVRDDDSDWQVRVADNGIGIAVEHRERIFEMFQRLHGDAQYAGAGIGLATCRRIVERFHGRIAVESEPGAGTTFVLWFKKAG